MALLARQSVPMRHDIDPRQALWDSIGNLNDVELFNNQVLMAIYVRPEKTQGGIILPGAHRDEDIVQSKVGMVVKMGPSAFHDETGKWFMGTAIELGDWVFFRASESWSCTVNDTLCRIIDDVNVRGKVPTPDTIW